MGFADLSIAEIAADYHLSEADVLALCDRFKIAYKSSKTRLALEDAKTIISHILAEQESSEAKNE